MGGPGSAADVTVIEDALRAQWRTLRSWVGTLDEAAGHQPSVLDGWSVEDVVAHLGRAMQALAVTVPAPAGTVPISLAEYLGTYPDRAAEIAAGTQELAAEIRDDPLPAVDALAAAAFARVEELRRGADDPVVQARRGPVLLSTMMVSRVIELVVHGDDLARSVRRYGPAPTEPRAVTLVAQALLDVVVGRGGWDLEVVDELAWIRLAAGRVPFGVDALAAALQARYTSDSLPDLAGRLPLL